MWHSSLLPRSLRRAVLGRWRHERGGAALPHPQGRRVLGRRHGLSGKGSSINYTFCCSMSLF